MGWNLPDDWGCYRSQCSACGQTRHASGTEECACANCARCGDVHPPRGLTTSEFTGEKVCGGCEEEEIYENEENGNDPAPVR